MFALVVVVVPMMTMLSAVPSAGGRYVFDDATNVLWTVGATGDGTATTPRGALGSPTAGPGAGMTSSSATVRGPSGSAFTFPPSPRHGGGGAGGAAPGSPRRAPGVWAGDAVGFTCSPWKRRHGVPWLRGKGSGADKGSEQTLGWWVGGWAGGCAGGRGSIGVRSGSLHVMRTSCPHVLRCSRR